MITKDLDRTDLLNLCRGVIKYAVVNGIKDEFVKNGFIERVPFVNGFFWKLSNACVKTATEEELLNLYLFYK